MKMPDSAETDSRSDSSPTADLDAIARLQALGALRLPEGSPLSPVLGEIVDAAIAIAGADFGSIQILDRETGTLRIAAHRGFPQWWVDFWEAVPAGRGSCGAALERGERVVVEDVEQSPLFVGTEALAIQRRAGVRAVQSTPLITRSGALIGMFSTHYRRPVRPDAGVIALLDLLARQAADIVDRAAVERERREMERRYIAIFRTSPLAIALSRMPDATLVDVNDAFLELFECTREEVVGKGSVDLGITDTDARARVRELLSADGVVRGFECTRRTRAGARRVLSLYITWVDIGWGKHVLTEVIDITAQKESEEAQRRLSKELAALNRELEQRVAERTSDLLHARQAAEAASAAKSEFLSSMSHELRTPMNAVLGFAQLLQRDRRRPLDERQLERVEHILRGGEHLLRLIDDVLDLAKIESGRLTISLEPVCLRSVLDEVLATLEPLAARMEITLLGPAPADLPRVTADRTRLTQILVNLGSNAIKYGKRGGRAEIAVRRTGDHVRITVTDDGIGIAAGRADMVFEPFQRAGQENGPIEGTGIGLAITRRLAEMMAGTVGFESEVDRGSAFWVELPVASAGAEDASEREVTRAAPRAAAAMRHKIVCIEDNPASVAFIEALVDDLDGVELVTAPNAELGLELIRAHRPTVVIMDINLPGMSGFDAVRHLRASPDTREIPVVGLSAAALRADTDKALRAGFTRYLTKPVKVDELSSALEQLLRWADTSSRDRNDACIEEPHGT